MRRLYRVHAVYREGHTVTRHYQTRKAAEDRAVRLREGYEVDRSTYESWDVETVPPAVTVTVTASNPITWPEEGTDV